MSRVIYLDNNSTTQLDKRALDAMMPFLTENYANAASSHVFGNVSQQAVEGARAKIAELIGANPNEIVFTSGASEAINLAIKGVAESYGSKGKHIITISTEHPAVLDTCKNLEGKGFEVTYLPVNTDGLIDIGVLKDALRNDTILVSVMFVNNETGVIQPMQEISELIHPMGVLLMTDGTQAMGKLLFNVQDLDIDLMSFSAHKFYGPKGIGGLFIREKSPKIKLPAFIHGGGHENGIRSGTLNVAGIVGMGKAAEIANNEMLADIDRVSQLRDYLEKELLKIKNTSLNGNAVKRLYNVTNICFKGIDANTLIGSLRNIAVSNGSACTSRLVEASHVLLAMGLNEQDAFSSIRFSLGRFNTKEEIDTVVEEIKILLQKNHSALTI
ncbi:MAG TPA: cysteine desulfurase family protein [Bacteroidia bacterium]|nr:cysteine desulfurase family protein [Bacteroidia bacterium]